MSDEERRLLLELRRVQRIKDQLEKQKLYIGIKEFARLADCSRSTIDRLRKRRPDAFPAEHNLWGRPRFKLSEVEAWLQSQPLW